MTQINGRNFAKKECGECGIEYYVPQVFENEQVKLGNKGGWFCPNGHSRVYRESTADKLRQERDRLQQDLAYKDDRIASEQRRRERAERSTAAYKGQVTKIKKRVGKGVCPCCNRQFQNVHKHMESQHPEYSDESPDLKVVGGT